MFIDNQEHKNNYKLPPYLNFKLIINVFRLNAKFSQITYHR